MIDVPAAATSAAAFSSSQILILSTTNGGRGRDAKPFEEAIVPIYMNVHWEPWRVIDESVQM
jgi:hypothetical protein